MRSILAALMLLPHAVAAQQACAPPAPKPLPCSQVAARAFDFWLGHWEVFDPKGEKAGDSHIEAVLGGCVLQERWRGRGNFEGMSFNSVDAQGRWMQHWVDNQGGRLNLIGGLQGTSMVLASLPDATTPSKIDRITWTPQDRGGVRQHWQQSTDSGATWRTLFDGQYRPRK